MAPPGARLTVDWAGWAVGGVLATSLLTAVMVAAQRAGWTRLDIPLVLGTFFAADPDRARGYGVLAHLAIGQVYALGYAATFALVGTATWWLGAMLGMAHAAVAGTFVIPLLPAFHPRMASERAGPDEGATLEPPGLLALNYGASSPAVAGVAHILYGALLGAILTAG